MNLSTLRWRLDDGDSTTAVIPDEPRSGDDPGSMPERLIPLATVREWIPEAAPRLRAERLP